MDASIHTNGHRLIDRERLDALYTRVPPHAHGDLEIRAAGVDPVWWTPCTQDSGAREKYTPAYRREAAHLVIDTGRPIAVVGQEIGVQEQLLGKWVALERSRLGDPPGVVGEDEREELARLRVENAELGWIGSS